jgi:hypothetical protein
MPANKMGRQGGAHNRLVDGGFDAPNIREDAFFPHKPFKLPQKIQVFLHRRTEK